MRKRLFLNFAVYLFYLLIATIITFPLVTQFSTHFAGNLPGPGDVYEYARHIWWFKYALQHGQPLFFHPLLAYPTGIPAAHLWANLLQSFPASLFSFFLPLPAVFNLMVLLRLALNGWAMWYLSSQLLAVSDQPKHKKTKQVELPSLKGRQDLIISHQRSVVSRKVSALSTQSSVLRPQSFFPALLAGVIFLTFPTAQSHLAASHSGLLVLWPFPLYIYSLLHVQQTGKRRWYALTALFFVFGCIGNYALVLYVLAPVTLFLLLARLYHRDWIGLRRSIVAIVFGGLGALIFLLPAAREVLNETIVQSGGAVDFSADLLAFAAPSPRNPLFSVLDYPGSILNDNVVEGAGYIGLAAAALMTIGIIRYRAARKWMLLALAAWVLSLGPLLKVLDQPVALYIGDEVSTYITLPWALFQHLPILDAARTPARFNFTVGLALSVMAGYGAAALWAWLEKRTVGARHALPLPAIRWILLVAAMGWILFEYQQFFPLPTARADLPQVLYDLAERDDVRAVFDIPWNSTAAKDGLYLQTAHEHPMIAGAVTRGTPVDHAMLWLLQQTLDPALLDAAGVDVIILHKQWVEMEAFDEDFTRAQLGEPFYEDDRFALFYAPVPAAPAEFTALPDPQSLLLGSWSSYFYAPSSGWVDWSAVLQGENVNVELLLEGEGIHRWTLSGETSASLPLWLPTEGYYTAAIQLSPACPSDPAPPLHCQQAQIDGLAISQFAPATNEPVSFERGLTLTAAYMPPQAQAGDNLPVSLVWQFDETRSESDVRFVHVLNANGELVAQVDASIGIRDPNTVWSEQVDVPLPADLTPGEYRVYVGWYTYPEVVNFCVLENGACVRNEALIGTVEIR